MQYFANTQAPDAPTPFSPGLPRLPIAAATVRWLTRPVIEPRPLRRVFIVGCPRSGTTVVQAALAERGNLMTLPETHFFSHLLGALEEWIGADVARSERRWHSRLLYARARTHGKLNAALAGPLQGRKLARHLSGRGYAGDFLHLLDRTAIEQGSAGWLEKTPEHFAYVDLIEALCPDARFVHVMRSGEDVVASAVEAEMRFPDRDGFRGGAAFWVRRWNRAAETHLQHAGQPGHLVISHEDLVGDSEATLARLLAFAQLDHQPRRFTRPTDIADLHDEPWKRNAVGGQVMPAARKFEAVFGPQTQDWIRSRLHDYGALRAEVARRQDRPR